ncbi:MAG: hypothetical protein ABIA93_03035 [Candidatus Woesearchaeota archaeon]
MSEIIEKIAMNMVEVKEELARIEKRDTELSFRAGRTKEYLNAVKLPTKKAAKEMSEKLLALEIPRLRDVHINKLIDLSPTSEAEIKVILQGYALTVNNENVAKMQAVFNEFHPKKKKAE